jgi:hypothetical protein
MKLEFSLEIVEKHSNFKFHENPSCGSRVIPCGQTDERADRQDEAIVAFRNFSYAPKNATYTLKQLGPRSRIEPKIL